MHASLRLISSLFLGTLLSSSSFVAAAILLPCDPAADTCPSGTTKEHLCRRSLYHRCVVPTELLDRNRD